MQFGHFDDAKKEYVIDRPDTPRAWTNYLGTTQYGAVISNNAGGYSFFHSAGRGRFMRFRLNTVPADQPGRYIYLRDRTSGDYWSASWQPVGKPLGKYRSICRHGTAYTIVTSEYANIETETTYFVPLGCEFECWLLRVVNKDKKPRKLSLFTYVEYPSIWNMQLDLINQQYTHGIVKMSVADNIIDHGCNVGALPVKGDVMAPDQAQHTFLAFLGGKIVGYDTDREAFLGPYRSYHNPAVVERGKCTGSLAVGDNGCGTLQIDVDLKPGQEKEFVVLMGVGEAKTKGKRIAARYGDTKKLRREFEKVKRYWHDRIEGMSVKTPDGEFNSMMNMWSPFNCLMTYSWSRTASFVYAALRDGLAYRDTVQDFLGVTHLIPEEAKQRLELMLTGQCSTGGAMPVVQPFGHRPGKEKTPKESEYRSDDCLWLFNAVPVYVKETGDIGFYKKTLPYADKGAGTVLGHLKRAIQFNLSRTGRHGLPSGLHADWNDCLRLGPKGESLFVAMQLRYALAAYVEICSMVKRPAEADWAGKMLKSLDRKIEKFGWDGRWYLRAYKKNGEKLGSKENKQASLYLNPQSWAVLSGHADKKRAGKIMGAVNKRLATEYGIMICEPPYENLLVAEIRSVLFNRGVKENAGIFSHTQGWAIMAETMLGRGDRAFEYFRAYMPAGQNSKAEIRQIEPYVYCQHTYSKFSPRYGTSRIPWLSGAASWAYYAATQYILGIRPEYDGLRIDPCIPAGWKRFTVRRRFRGKNFHITVKNSAGAQKGVAKITINGSTIEGNLVTDDMMKKENKVIVEMG